MYLFNEEPGHLISATYALLLTCTTAYFHVDDQRVA